ncbi:MAG: Zn-dependent hydrolase [Bacteroidetes bacterium]|nr:Zn-dependent hydrolase [Bacteroidota bacterium]
MKIIKIIAALTLMVTLAACSKNENNQKMSEPETNTEIQAFVDAFAPVAIDVDLSNLTEREKLLVAKLAEAGKICNEIFWQQSCHDAIAVRDSLSKLNDINSQLMLNLVNIYYGPYNKMNEYKRFVGNGPDVRPLCGGFYPIDMTKEEFEKHIADNPQDKAAFESQYTVIVRDENGKLKAVPYHEYYKQTAELAKLLDEAAELCDNPSLKKYLTLRAEAVRTDDYFKSDWQWMDLKDNNIDVVIGPIENYEDGLFNYKTAFEAVVMVKDAEATKDLEMFKSIISEVQNRLPWDKKYYVPAQQSGTVLQMVNVAYFGGDCQKATKTIAAALPNDPNVYEKKGGKKSMYKNLMEAKFDKIVAPIGQTLLSPELHQFIDKKSMISFVTMHEVSHNLGRGFVFGQNDLTVRKALKEKYSPLEELKADISSMFAHKVMFDLGKIDNDYLKKTVVTYIAGLFRSMRFGTESAHGIANCIQFRYLYENGAITKNQDGTYGFDENKFFDVVSNLTKTVLEIQSEGDYKRGTDFVNKYGNITPELQAEFDKIKSIPADLNSTYKF